MGDNNIKIKSKRKLGKAEVSHSYEGPVEGFIAIFGSTYQEETLQMPQRAPIQPAAALPPAPVQPIQYALPPAPAPTPSVYDQQAYIQEQIQTYIQAMAQTQVAAPSHSPPTPTPTWDSQVVAATPAPLEDTEYEYEEDLPAPESPTLLQQTQTKLINSGKWAGRMTIENPINAGLLLLLMWSLFLTPQGGAARGYTWQQITGVWNTWIAPQPSPSPSVSPSPSPSASTSPTPPAPPKSKPFTTPNRIIEDDAG